MSESNMNAICTALSISVIVVAMIVCFTWYQKHQDDLFVTGGYCQAINTRAWFKCGDYKP